MEAGMTANDFVVSHQPFVVRKRVLWGECDPAGVVYTPRFGDYLALAVGWFTRAVLEGPNGTLASQGVATPMKSMSLVFHRVLRPEETFDMLVTVGEIRTRTFDVHVQARGEDAALRFEGRLSPILVRPGTFESVAIPDAVRATLQAHRSA